MCRPWLYARCHRATINGSSVIARSPCDEAIHLVAGRMDCFAALAMTVWVMRRSHHHHDGILDQHLEGADQLGAERAVDRTVIAGQGHAHDVRGLDLAVAHHRAFLAGTLPA